MHLNFYRNLNLVVLKKVEEVRFMSRYSTKLAYVESVSNKFPLTLVKSSGKKKGGRWTMNRALTWLLTNPEKSGAGPQGTGSLKRCSRA